MYENKATFTDFLVTRRALFRARMRASTPRGLKARSMSVALGAKKYTHQRVITREEIVQL